MASPPISAAAAAPAESAPRGRKRPASPAAANAPSTMPKSITEVTSANTLESSAARWKSALQNASPSGLQPSSRAAFAPQSVNAQVMLQGCPASASVAKLSSASASAPAASGQGPLTKRARSACAGSGRSASAQRGRFNKAHSAPSTASCSTTAAVQPYVSPSAIASGAGSCAHASMCRLAQNPPAQNAASTSSMRALPPPPLQAPPEPHPPASCMPMPKRSAPAATWKPAGAIAPTNSRPNSDPPASAGANSSVAAASIRSCARTPRVLRRSMSARNAEAKPNAAWYSVSPMSPPRAASATMRPPCGTLAATRSKASAAAAASAPGWGAGTRAASAPCCILDDFVENRIELARHALQVRAAIGREHRARLAIRQGGRAVRILGHVDAQRRLDSGWNARSEHAHRVVIAEHHQHRVAGDFHAARGGAAARACLRDQPHFVVGNRLLHARNQGVEPMRRLERYRPRKRRLRGRWCDDQCRQQERRPTKDVLHFTTNL